MVVRMMSNAAVHGIAGTVLGVTTVLAACTVARSMQRMLQRDVRSGATTDSSSPNTD